MRARLTGLALASVLAVACGGGQESSTTDLGPAQPLAALAPGDPLESVQLPVLSAAAGGTVDMGDLGRPAVINFWATWCVFCVDEMPDFEQVHREVGDRVRFLGVDREDEAAKALDFVAEIGVTYELVEDVDGSFFRSAKGRGMPTTLFVDADGIIRYRHAGPIDAEQLRALIAEHLGDA